MNKSNRTHFNGRPEANRWVCTLNSSKSGRAASLFASVCLVAALPVQLKAAEEPLEEVTVTGIRASIQSAIEVKRESGDIVEAISAEDIGKLPDPSIAESLTRLPGVTAQRSDGRTSDISIRGFGPDFNGTLMNGREQVSTGDNRAIQFDQYPAELDRKSTRLNSSHFVPSRMPSSA